MEMIEGKCKTIEGLEYARGVQLHLGSRSGPHNLLQRHALSTFGYCGIAGVLVDIDHAIGYLLSLPLRFLHAPLLIAGGVVLCGCGAYLGGLLVGNFLGRRRAERILRS